ncbi:MAG: hypothetical protein Q8P18_32135 [Pseudomonadota bacterium]|nr:hypothetical protein [Pseudomonadota bacterium]
MIPAALAVGWRSAEPPLAPVAVAARGAAAGALARVLLSGATERAGLRGVAGPDLIVIIGSADVLPWADGCVYLGRHPDAPGLLFPTVWLPDAPLALYARAVLAASPADGAPVALLRAPDLRVPLGAARPVDLSFVRRWLDAPSAASSSAAPPSRAAPR